LNTQADCKLDHILDCMLVSHMSMRTWARNPWACIAFPSEHTIPSTHRRSENGHHGMLLTSYDAAVASQSSSACLADPIQHPVSQPFQEPPRNHTLEARCRK
jgi:hypothetical protein